MPVCQTNATVISVLCLHSSSQQAAVHTGLAVQSGPVHFSSSQRTLLDYSDLDAMTGTGTHSAQAALTTQVSFYIVHVYI